MRAELTDCLREADVAASETDSWSPAGIDAVGVGARGGNARPVASDGGIDPGTFGRCRFGFGCRLFVPARRGEGGGVFQPSGGPRVGASAVVVVPDTSTSDPGFDPGHPMYEPPVNARLAYLANVASEFVGVFCDQTLRRRVRAADAYHSMISVSQAAAARAL